MCVSMKLFGTLYKSSVADFYLNCHSMHQIIRFFKKIKRPWSYFLFVIILNVKKMSKWFHRETSVPLLPLIGDPLIRFPHQIVMKFRYFTVSLYWIVIILNSALSYGSKFMDIFTLINLFNYSPLFLLQILLIKSNLNGYLEQEIPLMTLFDCWQKSPSCCSPPS